MWRLLPILLFPLVTESFTFYKEPYRPPFFPGFRVPVRPPDQDQTHRDVLCHEPPDTDDRTLVYTADDVATLSPFSEFPILIPKGSKPNPEAIPVCAKWLSSNATLITTEECQVQCANYARTTCQGIKQNWVYRAWSSISFEYGGGDSIPNGMMDCMFSYFVASYPNCFGPCKTQVYDGRNKEVETKCLIPLKECMNYYDPRKHSDNPTTTTPSPTTTISMETTEPESSTTPQHDEHNWNWQLGVLGGAMVSGAGSAAICCYCSADGATRGLQDFSAQIGDGIDDVERIIRRDKCAEELAKDEHHVLRQELSARASS